MAKECTLLVKDEVNIQFKGLDPDTRRKMQKSLEYFLPHARHTPAYKLGRWNGMVSYCDIGARSYLNLLDKLIPIVQDAGYEIEIEDSRIPVKFEFETVDKDSYSHILWPDGHPLAGTPIYLRDHQIDMVNTCVTDTQCVSICPTAGGKAQPLYSKIKTPGGWTTMGEIQVGDVVSTPDGGTANVLGIYPQGEKDIYRITFADGRTAECCKDHLWNVYNKHFAGKEGKWRTWSLGEIQSWLSENESRTLHVPLAKHNDVNDVRLQIASIEKIGNELAQCIMIDHPDHLYITDNYVVTHNTIVTAILSEKVEKYGRSVVIVPTKDLVTQTEEDYINLHLDVGVYFGDRKEHNKKHTICTWQSLEVMNKKNDGAIEEFLKDVVCVMVDEVHKAKADVLRKLLSGPFANCPIRWGLTGTLPEEEYEKVSVQACIGMVNGIVKAKELQEKGYLADLHITVMQLKDFEDVFDSYQSELKWLTTNRYRIDYLASAFEEMSANGNTLVLVDRVETGKMLNDRIEGSVFISGAVKSQTRKDEYKSVQFEDDKVIIATYGVASTGININRVFNLVLLEPGKSFVRVIQSIGRGLRVAEDKDFVNVYDVTSTCKYSKRHLAKRKKFYKEAEYPFTVKKVDY